MKITTGEHCTRNFPVPRLRPLSQFSKFALGLAAIVAVACVSCTTAQAQTLPSGETALNGNSIEPAYNLLNGNITYLLTPGKAPEHTNQHGVAPLYVVMYPSSASGTIGTVNCQHQPADNCPDHGPALAGFAMATMPDVYGDGVWGHDHLVAAPPSPMKSGGDWNVAWLPVVVLFTSKTAANTHITTLDQLNQALAAGEVAEYPLPAATFQCSAVSASVYENGYPVDPVPAQP